MPNVLRVTKNAPAMIVATTIKARVIPQCVLPERVTTCQFLRMGGIPRNRALSVWRYYTDIVIFDKLILDSRMGGAVAAPDCARQGYQKVEVSNHCLGKRCNGEPLDGLVVVAGCIYGVTRVRSSKEFDGCVCFGNRTNGLPASLRNRQPGLFAALAHHARNGRFAGFNFTTHSIYAASLPSGSLLMHEQDVFEVVIKDKTEAITDHASQITRGDTRRVRVGGPRKRFGRRGASRGRGPHRRTASARVRRHKIRFRPGRRE